MDRYDLYELAVTDPPRLARFLTAVHGHAPRTLREDFSGSAALARHWATLTPRHTAIAVDKDPEPLARAGGSPRLTLRQADVLRARDSADLIAAVNFPLGYCHTRASLLKYLGHARACLRPRGVLVADLYGGEDAFTPGSTTVALRAPGGVRVDYTWEQRAADPVTGRVLNAMHFQIHGTRAAGTPSRSRTPAARARASKPARPARAAAPRAAELRDAFVYDWRLWSIPELADAMHDAGFRRVDIYHRMGDAIDQDGRLLVFPTRPGDDLGPSWVVYVAARR